MSVCSQLRHVQSLLSKNLAGWPGPERGGEWTHIQLAARHQWGSPGSELQLVLLVLSGWGDQVHSQTVCRWRQVGWKCWSVWGYEGSAEGSQQDGSVFQGLWNGIQQDQKSGPALESQQPHRALQTWGREVDSIWTWANHATVAKEQWPLSCVGTVWLTRPGQWPSPILRTGEAVPQTLRLVLDLSLQEGHWGAGVCAEKGTKLENGRECDKEQLRQLGVFWTEPGVPSG